MVETPVEAGQWYWFFKDWGKPPKHRPWLVAIPPEGRRLGRAYPRSRSDLETGEAVYEHARHQHCESTCRLDEDAWIVQAEQFIEMSDLEGTYSCTEDDFDVQHVLQQWSFFLA